MNTMINANELRIGNLIYHPATARNIVVDYHHIRIARINHDNGYQPIPLTPEILDKAGFVTDRNGWQLPLTKFSLTEKLYPCWLDRMLWPQDIADFKERRLEFMHQLQNLYFALTGKELTVLLVQEVWSG